jgi:hypothetical protein
MNSSSIFEIAMNCPPGLTHPRLTENNAWVDALLEEICRAEEERFCGREPEQVSILGKRERAESDISDYEEEIDNVVSRCVTPTIAFELDVEEENYWDIMDKMEAGLLTRKEKYSISIL